MSASPLNRQIINIHKCLGPNGVFRVLKDLAQKGHPLVFCTLQMGIAREVANCLPFLHIGLPQEVDSTAEVLTSPKRQPLRPAQFLSSELK